MKSPLPEPVDRFKQWLILLILAFVWFGIIIPQWVEMLAHHDTVEVQPHWKNDDPSRSPFDVAEYDYKNRMIIWREPKTATTPVKIHQKTSPYNGEGLIITSGNVSIHTQLTVEDLLDQMDIEFEDLHDYLGDELR